MHARSIRKEQELCQALGLLPQQLWPVLRALRAVLGVEEIVAWIERNGATASERYIREKTSPRRGGEHPDGSGPIPPVPGRRAA